MALRGESGSTVNAVLASNLLRPLLAAGVGVVEHGDVGTSLCEGMRHAQADPGAGAGDDGRLALEREHGEDARVLGGGGVVMDKSARLGDWTARHDGVYTRQMNQVYEYKRAYIRKDKLGSGDVLYTARRRSRVLTARPPHTGEGSPVPPLLRSSP